MARRILGAIGLIYVVVVLVSVLHTGLHGRTVAEDIGEIATLVLVLLAISFFSVRALLRSLRERSRDDPAG